MEDKKKNLLKPLLVLLAVILLVSGTGIGVWWWQNGELNKQKTDSDKKISELQKQVNDTKNQTATKTTSKAASNWKTYINNQDSFQISFPDYWAGYGVSEALDDAKKSKHIYFGLPIKNPDTVYDFGFDRNYTSLFAISVTEKAEYEATKDEPGVGQKIGEKGSKVYTYSQSNGIPGELNTGNAETAAGQIKEIIASFKILE
ncbi:MAG: hypothetical protein Q7S53_04475 [bacterium]|nr:hypothetical protein [bacterium]